MGCRRRTRPKRVDHAYSRRKRAAHSSEPRHALGELLRRYWHPVAAAAELTEEKPIRAVKILGEELVVYRDKKGNFGLLGEHSPHRSASLAYGRVTKRGFGVPIMAGSSIAQVDVSNSRRSRRGARSRIESSCCVPRPVS